jgi:hypothetical protein
MVSGSYSPGDIYFFRGLGNGKYAAREKIRFDDGRVLRAGTASSVALADWDRDGKIDLIVGNSDGEVRFFPNVSRDGRLAFGRAKYLVDRNSTGTSMQDAGPVVADWNGDGIPDLLVGSLDGSVTVFLGSGKTGAPVLARGNTLVESILSEDWKPVLCTRDPATGQMRPPEFERPGMRTKIAVFDFNGDGKPDLLVGDVCSSKTPDPFLTSAQVKERDDLETEVKSVGSKLSNRGEEVRRRARHEVESHPPETGDFDIQELVDDRIEEELAKDAQYCELEHRVDELWTKLAPFQARLTTHGFVWVYLRTTTP